MSDQIPIKPVNAIKGVTETVEQLLARLQVLLKPRKKYSDQVEAEATIMDASYLVGRLIPWADNKALMADARWDPKRRRQAGELEALDLGYEGPAAATFVDGYVCGATQEAQIWQDLESPLVAGALDAQADVEKRLFEAHGDLQEEKRRSVILARLLTGVIQGELSVNEAREGLASLIQDPEAAVPMPAVTPTKADHAAALEFAKSIQQAGKIIGKDGTGGTVNLAHCYEHNRAQLSQLRDERHGILRVAKDAETFINKVMECCGNGMIEAPNTYRELYDRGRPLRGALRKLISSTLIGNNDGGTHTGS